MRKIVCLSLEHAGRLWMLMYVGMSNTSDTSSPNVALSSLVAAASHPSTFSHISLAACVMASGLDIACAKHFCCLPGAGYLPAVNHARD